MADCVLVPTARIGEPVRDLRLGEARLPLEHLLFFIVGIGVLAMSRQPILQNLDGLPGEAGARLSFRTFVGRCAVGAGGRSQPWQICRRARRMDFGQPLLLLQHPWVVTHDRPRIWGEEAFTAIGTVDAKVACTTEGNAAGAVSFKLTFRDPLALIAAQLAVVALHIIEQLQVVLERPGGPIGGHRNLLRVTQSGGDVVFKVLQRPEGELITLNIGQRQVDVVEALTSGLQRRGRHVDPSGRGRVCLVPIDKLVHVSRKGAERLRDNEKGGKGGHCVVSTRLTQRRAGGELSTCQPQGRAEKA